MDRYLRALTQREISISISFVNRTKKWGKIDVCNPEALMELSNTVDQKAHLYFTRIKLS